MIPASYEKDEDERGSKTLFGTRDPRLPVIYCIQPLMIQAVL